MSELAGELGRVPNGKLTRILKELEYAGFVSSDAGLNPATGEALRMERYRIKDNYTRFYLHCIEPKRRAIAKGLFSKASLEQLDGWTSNLGFQFENLVLNHTIDLFPLLGLDRTLVLSAAPFVQRGTRRGDGFQIDLLIQSKRGAMVVEIKRRREIGREAIGEVNEKVEKLRRLTKASIRTALVYCGHLAPSVESDGFFDFIVPAEKLLR